MENKNYSRTTMFAIILFGSVGGLLFGYDTGIIGSALVFLKTQYHMTPMEVSMVTSAIIVGAFVGSPLFGTLADKYGRRPIIFIMGSVFAIGSIGASRIDSLTALIIWRFVLGLAVGGASAIVPMYLSEMAPTRIRGAMATFDQIMINTGTVLSTVAGYTLASSGNWRMMFLLAVIPSIIMILGMVSMAESPRWLIMKGRVDEARKILLRTRTPEETEEEIKGIVAILSIKSEGGMKEFKKPYLKKILIMGSLVLFFQQMTGFNIMVFYLPTILIGMGIAAKNAIGFTVAFASLGIVATLYCAKIVDKVGRKKLLEQSSLVIGFCLLAMAISLWIFGNDVKHVMFVAIPGLILVRIYFSTGWGAGAWIYVSEIFPIRVRGLATSSAVCTNWFGNFLVAFTFPLLLSSVGLAWSYFIFFVLNMISFAYTYYNLYETKGQSLEQIEGHFREKYGDQVGA
ncbi:sugar/inositol transporter [Lucifera butyrica]|uniref:Sugar/inositol transporter n=1 Tax=Lucifera butyrica TaxID=1351585 RepID=A0A498R9X3_9FIRM|nr:sugar porter family MFS transporter [Lucifera butyrica]VBB07740.1 sugar/inositol transporter [Lucifera butyrica]